MNAYNELNAFIGKFADKDASIDFWYDFAVTESTDLVNKLEKCDWDKLLKEINNKNHLWKIRLLESFDASNWKEKKKIVLKIIRDCDDELLLAIIDYLRDIKEHAVLLNNAELMNKIVTLGNKSEPNRVIIKDFLEKIQAIHSNI